MSKFLTTIAVVFSVVAAPAFAEGKTFVSYAISKKSPVVKGRFTTNGYSIAQIKEFIKQDCNGTVDDITLVGKARKKRGSFYQKYSTTCQNGPIAKYNGRVLMGIERKSDGRDYYEVTTSDGNGQVIFQKGYR